MNGRRCAALAVAARRGEMGMTQQQLAAAAKVDVKTLRDLERARHWPNAVNRVKVEGALGWPVGELDRIREEGDAAGTEIPAELWEHLANLTQAERAVVMRMLAALHEGPVPPPRSVPPGQQPQALL